jgi:3-phenylpropionate/trans-cinnamate dioxygenase ferredoxin subunit
MSMSDLQRAAALADVPEGGVLAVEVGGVELALVRTDDEVFAIEDECSHAAIPLSEGEVEGCEIECWLHGSMFDLRTGKPTNLPATEPVNIYHCKVDGDAVYVDVHHPLNTDQES